MSTAVPTRQYEDEIDLLRYGRFLASYWILLAGCALTGAVAAFALASLIPPRFQATGTMMLSRSSGATPLVLSPATAKALVANLAVVSETINELGLNRDGMTTQQFIDDALDVQTVPSTSLVKLSITLPDPTKARLAVTMLATKVVDLTQRIDRDGASAARAHLEKQMADAQVNLKKAEERLIEFQTRANIEKLEAEVQILRRQQRDAVSQRIELYRQRLELERLHTDFIERARLEGDLARRYEDARGTPVGTPQLQILAAPVQPDHALPRRRPRFAILGGLVGLVCGVVAALLINKRRVERRAAV
jgi:uncharacterized protein involved in exopolysaccharide biosynthesis